MNESLIRWMTLDGNKPVAQDLKCGIFSGLAKYLNLQCQVKIQNNNSKHEKNNFPLFSVHHGFGFHNWIHDFDGCSDWFAADD